MSIDGEVMLSSFAEAKYLYGALSKLPNTYTDDNDGALYLKLPEQIREVDRCAVTLPWGGLHNYGHFVLDCLPSITTLQRFADPTIFPFLFPILKPWQREHIAMMAVANQTEINDDICYCHDVVWTSNMDHHLQGPNASVLWMREAITSCDPKDLGRKIWLSRGDDPKRHFKNNDVLEKLLEQSGFEIIRPEALSIADQIAAFSGAAVIGGFTGAAFANVAYCRAGTVVIEIQPSLMPGTWVRNLAATVGCEWVAFFCDSKPPPNPAVIGGKARGDIGIEILLDVEQFVAFVSTVVSA